MENNPNCENSSDLLLSNMILNLNDDPDQGKDFSWVKPGKYMGVWWEMIGTNESTGGLQQIMVLIIKK